MENDIKKVLVSNEEINDICKKLGKQISKDYEGKDLVIVGLLKGCLPFMSDLFKEVTIYAKIDYMRVSSYAGKESTGKIKILNDISFGVTDKDVLIVDDIIDTGLTLEKIKNLFLARKAKSVKTCVLLDKPEGRTTSINADYVGTTVPKEFVVGYGLDYNDYYRNLSYIGVLKEEVYQK